MRVAGSTPNCVSFRIATVLECETDLAAVVT
jgi:hypothetical protein